MVNTGFSKLAFYPSVIFNYLMTHLTKRRWFDRIDDTVVLGALPLRKLVVPYLVRKENIKGVISLLQDYETVYIPSVEAWQKMGIRQLSLPIADYWGTPSQEDIRKALAFLDDFRAQKASVYVHCKAGRTRSATILACYLIKRYNLVPDEAVERIKSRRPHIWLRAPQWSTIMAFYDQLLKDGKFSRISLHEHPELKD